MYIYFTVYTFYWGHSFLHIATGQLHISPTVLKIIASEMLLYSRHAFVLVVNGHSIIKAVVQVYMYMCSSCVCVACVVAYTDHCARSMSASLL